MKKLLSVVMISCGLCCAADAVAEQTCSPVQTPSVQVRGHSRIQVDPDMARIHVQFSVTDSTDAGMARKKLENIFGVAVGKLKALGLADDELIAESLYTSRNELDDDKAGKKRFEYEASRTLVVNLKNLALMDRVIEIVLDNRSNAQIRYVAFDISDKTKYADQAKNLAVQDSIRQAKAVSAGYNAKISRVLRIDYNQSYDLVELNGTAMRSAGVMANKSAAADGAGAYFKPQKITIRDDVDVTFELEAGRIE
jgi:uncharacterized protein YggE